jgi:hypothetical protein
MDIEKTITVFTVILLAVERVFDKSRSLLAERRRLHGGNLGKAFSITGGVLNELYALYESIRETEGFHSLRFLSAHNSGADMSTTMLWKSTVLATYPSNTDINDQWQDLPLDHEYLQCVLRPVVEGGAKSVYTQDLAATGPLGAVYNRQGIAQSYVFLINKTDNEIVYASVAFQTAGPLTSDQLNAIRICRANTAKAVAHR